ncbi:MAG: uroporphyrinogen-III synthase [Acidobacteria bacterium]|jgi:uroporphyrinogen III methyltransferase/synthase|nr:uroporphyrinogen-III synthase [Acidobacteriota bacterium]MBA4122244.1 uroporphyrinogen-III synthase [Acidobacteriota bacterium]
MRAILVIREFDNFSRILSESGLKVINCQTIAVAPLEDLSEFEAKLDAIENYDGVFLTSANATEIFRTKLSARNVNFQGKIYVLGKRSFDLLKSENLNLVFAETANTAREMLENIALDELKNKRFLFVRGEKSLRVVPEFLGKIASVDEAIVYRSSRVTIADDKIKEIQAKSANGEIACACFFSPSGARSFLQQFGAEVLHQIKITVIGNTTAEFFERRDLKVDFVARRATAEDFAVELIEYLKI